MVKGWFKRILALSLLLSRVSATAPSSGKARGLNNTLASRDLASNGLTDLVQWDEYSLFVKGQRLFIWAGEFHPFRLPVPSLWVDVLEKVKAAGFNAISVYINWAVVNPSSDQMDFDGYRAMKPLFDACMATGLWLILRPGPYINAEVNGGGIPGWVTSEIKGHLRGNDSDWQASWTPYMKALVDLSKSAQITEGGPLIAWQVENEYNSSPNGIPGKAQYLQQIEQLLGDNGIVIPTTFNDNTWSGQYKPGTQGGVNLYGVDSYPQGKACENPTSWGDLPGNLYQFHKDTTPQIPFFFPEFQSGAWNPWGPGSSGFDKCRELMGAAYSNVFHYHLFANNAKMVSLYMIYGGTSWGSLPFPSGYTSYDYGAGIIENRTLSNKYDELKRQGLFLRSALEFTKTDRKGESTDGNSGISVDNSNVLATALVNPDSGAGFYFARQTSTKTRDKQNFKLTINTSNGQLTLPQASGTIELAGRQSKLIVTDFAFGTDRLTYATAEVYFAGVIGGRNVLFLHGRSTQSHEISGKWSTDPSIAGNSNITVQQSGDNTVVVIQAGVQGIYTLANSQSQLVLYADSETAATFWAPVIAPSNNPFGTFWAVGTNETVLVGGPYLVRDATLNADGSEIALRGDLEKDVSLTVIGPASLKAVKWNGQAVALSQGNGGVVQSAGVLFGQLKVSSALAGIQAPTLGSWKYKDGLPEVASGFDDSKWTAADHNTTNIPWQTYFGVPPILFGCDYGFCEGTILFRGHFTGSAQTSGANFTINGGEAFAASVWINGQFVKTTYGSSQNNANVVGERNDLYSFPQGSINVGGDNVVTVLLDNSGLDEVSGDDYPKAPRGIRGAQLVGGNFDHWKVQGRTGGYKDFPDKVRGVVNEGGTAGERAGWHLPGFDTSKWESRDITSGLPNNNAGVGVFVTKFKLDIPKNVDVPMSFVFDDGVGDIQVAYRAYLFVNGWMMGKRVANMGPQAKFPVHEGILDFHGENTVAVVVWAQENSDKIKPKLQIEVAGRYESGMSPVEVNNPTWKSRDGSRENGGAPSSAKRRRSILV